MSIVFDPRATIKKIAPVKKVERILNKNLSVNRAALSFVNDLEFLNKKDVVDVALQVVKSYKKRIKNTKADDGREAAKELKDEIIDDPKLLINRVQNEVVFQMHESIKQKYNGEVGIWLPSDAEEPRPEHQFNYGKQYIIGEGIDGVEPGDEYGCQCGVEILVDETQLDL